MLALEGNTAPYMLYAYARVRSIGRTAGVDLDTLPPVELQIQHETEIALAKQLLSFPEALEQVSQELRPHILAEYLYSLGRAYSRFYDREHGVRVVNAETDELRLSRLRLCDLTARTLKLGLAILGIEVVEQM
jgi:arginyl-tRNA synthetase